MTSAGESDWLMDVPDGWTVTEHVECLTLTPATNDGSLQFSSASKENGPITNGELEELATRQAALTGRPFEATFGEFHGLGTSYEDLGVAWRRYWLANDSLLLFITYNGDPASTLRTFAQAERALATLRRA